MAMKTSTLDGKQITGLQDRLRNRNIFSQADGVLNYYGNKFEITYTSTLITISTGALLIDGTLCVNETQITQTPISTTATIYLKARSNLATGVSEIYQSLTSTLNKQDSILYPSGTTEFLLATLKYPVSGTAKYQPSIIQTVPDIITTSRLTTQNSKITADSGGVYVSITGSIDSYLKTTGIGFRTVGLTNLPDAPTTGSYRGWFHKTGLTDANHTYGYGHFYLIGSDGSVYVWYFAGITTLSKTSWVPLGKQKENPRQANGTPRLLISSTTGSANIGNPGGTRDLLYEAGQYLARFGNGDYEFYANGNALATPYKVGLTTEGSLFGRMHIYSSSVTINAVNYKGESFSIGGKKVNIEDVDLTWSPWVKHGEVWETVWKGNTIISPTTVLDITKQSKSIVKLRLHSQFTGTTEYHDIPVGIAYGSRVEWHVPVLDGGFNTIWLHTEVMPNWSSNKIRLDARDQNSMPFRLFKIEAVYA